MLNAILVNTRKSRYRKVDDCHSKIENVSVNIFVRTHLSESPKIKLKYKNLLEIKPLFFLWKKPKYVFDKTFCDVCSYF